MAALALLGGCTAESASRGSASSSAGSAAGASGGGADSASSPTPSPTGGAPATPSPAAAPTPTGLRWGPGPQTSYTVQPQSPAGSCHYRYQGNDPLPDAHCTPGALNPNVTQATIGSTICHSGYTSSIRPPESVTGPEKQGSAAAYGYSGSFSTAEYDHLVPLELGGDPNDPANLWVEPNDDPNAASTYNSKDVLENRLNALVCSGQLTLVAAQEDVASDWAAAYQQFVGSQPSSASPPNASPTPSGSPASGGSAYCTAAAASANDGYSGDYYVTVDSNQPHQKATASDAGDSWSATTDASGHVRVLLYHTSPGEQIEVTVGAASCSTTA